MRHFSVAAALMACAVFVALPALAQPIQFQAPDNINNTPVSAANPLPITGSISATNPSVGTSGSAIPSNSTLVGSKDVSGNLQPASSANPIPVVDAQLHTDAMSAIPAGTNVIGKVGIDQTTPGTTNGVQVNAALPAGANVVGYISNDPCAQAAKSYADFSSTTSGGSIVTAVSAKKVYLCSVSIIASAAANVSLIEGTGASVCTAGTTAGVFLNSGVTAANGAAVAANGGIQAGNGSGTVAASGTANQNVCVAFTTTNSPQVNVHVAYVQQ